MKKTLIVLGVIIALVLVLGFVFRSTIQFMAMLYFIQPATEFADSPPPAAPDYANATHWAALPDREDDADITPNGAVDVQASAPVDVFFVHPTTYLSPDHWNQPLDDEEANARTRNMVLRGQASAFNGCCAIYAPHYRQATLYSFMDDGDSGPAALDLAYGDVSAAFEYYLANHNQGRPFILAGHSQGAEHVDRLLRQHIVGQPLAQQMVAAYPVGYFLNAQGSVPVCDSATELGCQVTWNTVSPDAPSFRDTSNDICVNPLTWRANGERAGFDQNLGSISFADSAEPELGVVDAQCEDGRLLVSEVRSERYNNMVFGPGNYHIYDYGLFYMNVRENAQARVAAYLATNAP